MRRVIPTMRALLCRGAIAWLAAAAVSACFAADAAAQSPAWRQRVDWRGRWTTVEAAVPDSGPAVYRFDAGAPNGAPRSRRVAELPGGPRLRTGNALFDGLFALAVEEAGEDGVEQITDGQFNDGRAIPCHCYETGAKWHYVWTRDISYAVDLGLGLLDPARALNSLRFKRSGLRGAPVASEVETPLFVAQDTGSGGSWPVSTDRVVWIHAAMGLLGALPPADAASFEPELRRIARDTLGQDRAYAYDPQAGLYRGETSFLDWREQNYPAWTRSDTRYIAASYALSTNVLHYAALRDAASLERRAGSAQSAAYDREADELRQRINERFWQADRGLYASYLGPDLAPAAAYDLLGTALAVLDGVADARHAGAALARYPQTAAGPPVLWPQQPGVAIYHNRALWPFVTAYALAAARQARDPARMTAFAESLIRGAALALSNVENFEYLTQQTEFEDGPLSGPVINSPRQLWSVAGYVGTVVRELFGVRLQPDGVEIAPALPGALATELFAPRAQIALENVLAGGRRLNVRLRLPEHWAADDLLEAGTIAVDGVTLDGRRLPPPVAGDAGNEIDVELVARPGRPSSAPLLAAADPHAPTAAERRALIAPPTPELASGWRAGAVVRLRIAGIEPDGRWHVYRDGLPRASGAAGEPFEDRVADPHRTACYAATAQAADGGLESLPSPELCLAGTDSRRIFAAASDALASPDAHPLAARGAERLYLDWGAPAERLVLSFTPAASGWHRLVLRYGNASGPVNTGITAAVKRVSVSCAGNRTAASGAIVMPHLPEGTFGHSTGFAFEARRSRPCRIVISDGFNMSYLDHFTLYTGGRGGRDGARNRADVAGAQIDAISRPRLGGE